MPYAPLAATLFQLSDFTRKRMPTSKDRMGGIFVLMSEESPHTISKRTISARLPQKTKTLRKQRADQAMTNWQMK